MVFCKLFGIFGYMETKNYINEVWKPIRGYVGYYEVSNFGRVRSLDRWITYKDGRKIFYKSVILQPAIATNGYYTVVLRKNNKSHTKTVHRLVAEAFIPNPQNLPEVNHKDFNKLNNFIGNLEWVSHKTNNTFGVKPFTGIVKEVYQFSLNNYFINKHASVEVAGLETQTNPSTIRSCVKYHKWHKTAGGFKWSYKHKSTIQLDDAPCDYDATYCIIPI